MWEYMHMCSGINAKLTKWLELVGQRVYRAQRISLSSHLICLLFNFLNPTDYDLFRPGLIREMIMDFKWYVTNKIILKI